MARPTLVMFAGVNGAGKSTFFHSGRWAESSSTRSMQRVNPDEILIGNGGDPSSAADQLKAGREALRLIDECLTHRRSFNQETTLTGRSPLRTLKRAREYGYRILMYYIGVDSPETCLARIARRVQTGGHDISDTAVRRRYRASLRNLSNALDLCDEVTVLDNTVEFVTAAQWARGVLCWVGDLPKHAPWLLEAIKDEALWRK